MSSRAKKKTTEEKVFCDLSVGYDTSGISPLILMCRKEAKLYKHPGVFGGVVALCDDHKDWTPPPRRGTVET